MSHLWKNAFLISPMVGMISLWRTPQGKVHASQGDIEKKTRIHTELDNRLEFTIFDWRVAFREASSSSPFQKAKLSYDFQWDAECRGVLEVAWDCFWEQRCPSHMPSGHCKGLHCVKSFNNQQHFSFLTPWPLTLSRAKGFCSIVTNISFLLLETLKKISSFSVPWSTYFKNFDFYQIKEKEPNRMEILTIK